MTSNLIQFAESYCEQHKLRFTKPREQVLAILAAAKKPLGAYDILQHMTSDEVVPKPPTVYRAIQFWCEQGFAHCIDSLKAYVACPSGHHIGQVQFFICQTCGDVSEETSIIDKRPLQASAEKRQFTITNCTTEIKGFCSTCVTKAEY